MNMSHSRFHLLRCCVLRMSPALLCGALISACATGGDNRCDGLVAPTRIVQASPATLTLDVGLQGRVSASVSGSCADEQASVQWVSDDTLIARVDDSGRVLAIGPGTTTLIASAFGQQAITRVPVTIRPRFAARLDVRGVTDTLLPESVRTLGATVQDQVGDTIDGPVVIWRALTPTLASVTAAGVLTALSSGTAAIEAVTPSISADSLRDTVRVIIQRAPTPVPPVIEPPVVEPPPVTPPPITPPPVTPPPVTPPPVTPPPVTPPPVTPPPVTPPPVTPPPVTPPPAPRDCSVKVSVQLATPISGKFDSTSCQNVLGFRIADQYSITGTAQQYFSLRLEPGVRSALVPLLDATSFHSLPLSDTAVTALVVMRSGTFGFLVTSPVVTSGSYLIRTTLNPDARLSCAPTYVTRGVTFSTAITPGCTTRDIHIVPRLLDDEEIRITAAVAGRGVTIELRNAATGALIRSRTTSPGNGRATIDYENDNDAAELLLVRVRGATGTNEVVTVTISR